MKSLKYGESASTQQVLYADLQPPPTLKSIFNIQGHWLYSVTFMLLFTLLQAPLFFFFGDSH